MTNEILQQNKPASPKVLKTEYIKPEDCIFSESENGFLQAKIKDREFKRVILTRALPLSLPNEYICISDVEKKELGIIENISDFSPEQQRMINKELSMRYFCPVISEILTIKEKMGNFYFDVKIGEHKKSFTVKDITKSIRRTSNSIDITDISGNRFRITDFQSIAPASRRKLEPYLY